MKRLMLVAALVFVASLIFASAAAAQMTEMVEETIMGPGGEATIEAQGPPMAVEQVEQQFEQKAAPAVAGGGTAGLPPSGGLAVSSVLLPVAALLLGSGVLAYAILRRR